MRSYLRQRPQEQIPQLRSVDLRAIEPRVSRDVEKSMGILVEQAHPLVLVASLAAELLHQAGQPQCELSESGIKIKRAALRTRERMCICLEDRTLDAVDMQNASKGQSTWACSDDGDTWYGHWEALFQ